MQRDAKMVSYKVVDKSAKPYVEVDVAGEKKVPSIPVSVCRKATSNHCLMPSFSILAFFHVLIEWQT